jgi:hypothetical protein
MTLFHPDAESEYLAAIDYYSAIENRLAAKFAHAVEAAIARVAREPRFREIAPAIRLCRVTNFPLYDSIQRNQQDCACGKT